MKPGSGHLTANLESRKPSLAFASPVCEPRWSVSTALALVINTHKTGWNIHHGSWYASPVCQSGEGFHRLPPNLATLPAKAAIGSIYTLTEYVRFSYSGFLSTEAGVMQRKHSAVETDTIQNCFGMRRSNQQTMNGSTPLLPFGQIKRAMRLSTSAA